MVANSALFVGAAQFYYLGTMATAKLNKLSLNVRRRRSPDIITKDSGVVLHEGWAIKESGGAIFGRTNWRKRWFRLVQRSSSVTLEYYRGLKEVIPAGYVHLNVTYCTRPVESHSKPHPNCFAVGPLLEDGATRTYYISCSDRLAMQEWIAVIDAAIQGVPEQAHRRRQTVNKLFATRYKEKLKQTRERNITDPIIEQPQDEGRDMLDLSMSLEPSGSDCCDSEDSLTVSTMVPATLSREELTEEEMMDEIDDDILDEEDDSMTESWSIIKATSGQRQRLGPDVGLTIEQRLTCYSNPSWRLEQWNALCTKVKTIQWTRSDTKDGVTIARSKFGRSSMGHAVMKVEGVLPAAPKNVYKFLQLSTKDGGKLDYIFRNEYLVQELQSEPKATVIYNEFQPPLPRVSKRDIVAMKIWIPSSLTTDGKTGFVMFSVEHPDVPPPEKGYTRISVDTSGFVLSCYPGPNNEVHTKMTVLVQVAFYGAMHKMLKGAYNSGLLKLGFRTTFNLIAEQLDKFIEVTNI